MIDLHIHLGGAVPASVLWEILCDNGLETEFEDFEALQDYLSVRQHDIKSLDDFLGRYFHATELIQSSPDGASAAMYQMVAKAYRRGDVNAIEVRFNPLKRLRGGVHSMDAVVLASLHGLERASMHYKVKTGIIFSMGKELTFQNNWKIVETATNFCCRAPLMGAHGIVGIDMAGPESLGLDTDKDWLKEVSTMVETARRRGLGVTWHVGETDFSGPQGMEAVLDIIQPDRIGHGIQLRKARGKQKERLCAMLRERKVCLELCPSVNLVTGSIDSYQEVAELVRLLDKEEIPFCVNTDNPYIINTNILRETQILEKELGKDKDILLKAGNYARQASFMSELKASANATEGESAPADSSDKHPSKK